MKYIILVVLFLYLLYKMVTSCSAYGCTARRKKDSGISFHRFPVKHPELYRKWVQAVARDDFIPTEDCFICSKHFTNNCFKATKARCRLRNDAVPSIFSAFPLYMQKKETKRKSPKKRKFLIHQLNRVNHHHPKYKSQLNWIIHTVLRPKKKKKGFKRKFQSCRKRLNP